MVQNYLNDLFSIEGRTAVVIGGAGVLGFALAKGLGSAGAHVIIADLKDDACQARAAELQQCGVKAGWSTVDVTQRSSIENLLAATLKQTGRADILVNC